MLSPVTLECVKCVLQLRDAEARRVLCRTNYRLIPFLILAAFVAATGDAEDGVSIETFAQVNEGRYQVFAQGGHQMAFQVNMFMNEMLRQYETYFNNVTLKRAARVVVFSNNQDFRQYATAAIGHPHPWLQGYCKPMTDSAGNSSFELVVYQSGAVWPTLAHEGFHQFLAYELGPRIPVWLNEGMAQFFETSHYLGSTFDVGSVNFSKLQQVQALIRSGKSPRLNEIIGWNPATFYGHAEIAYPMSWALVYYLLKSNQHPAASAEFRQYLQAVRAGGDDLQNAQERLSQSCQRWQSDFEESFMRLGNQMGLQ